MFLPSNLNQFDGVPVGSGWQVRFGKWLFRGEQNGRLGGAFDLHFELTCDHPVVPGVVLEFILGLLVVSGDNFESDTISEHLKRDDIVPSKDSFAHLAVVVKKVSLMYICQSASQKSDKNLKVSQYNLEWKSFG